VTPTAYLLIFIGGFIAGMINSVAGGGTLISFPLLTFVGIDHKIANATNTVALCTASLVSAFGFRKSMPTARKFTLQFSIVSVLGSILGTILLIYTPSTEFEAIIPWLILLAAVLFMIQEPITKRFAKPPEPEAPAVEGAPPAEVFKVPKGAMLFQFCVGIYGGYFGAGMGIMMLAVLGFLQFGDIYRMNYLKNLAAFLINGVSAIILTMSGISAYMGWGGEALINWPVALVMTAGAISGGFLGAGAAKKVGPRALRAIVSLIGLSIAAYMLYDRMK
jgi:uncharacterized protein